MKRPLCLALVYFCLCATGRPQSPAATAGAANPVQLSSGDSAVQAGNAVRELRIPAGTPLEIEAAYSVSSLDVRPEDLISFRVLVPVRIDGITVIEKNSLVTACVVEAKRGGHWGKAGKLSWIMQDVVAVDLTRVPVDARADRSNEPRAIKGTSHGGQVATEMIVMGSLMWVIAPVVLLHGFKRGENAVLPEGKRFIAFVKRDTMVKVPVAQSGIDN
jgi:hypothetical protein